MRGRCYATRKSNGWMVDRAEEIAEATRLARRAVELGRDDAIALSYGGYVLGYVGGDLDDSAACIDRALALNPNLAAALGVSSWVRACLGEPRKAVEHAALAMRLSPLDPRLFAWQFNTGLAHFVPATTMMLSLGREVAAAPAELRERDACSGGEPCPCGTPIGSAANDGPGLRVRSLDAAFESRRGAAAVSSTGRSQQIYRLRKAGQPD